MWAIWGEGAKNQLGALYFSLKILPKNDLTLLSISDHSFALVVIQSYPIVVSQLSSNWAKARSEKVNEKIVSSYSPPLEIKLFLYGPKVLDCY